jgi:hypothetical protein
VKSEPATPLPLVEYLDVVLVLLVAPIALLTGVSALGYGVGAGAWLALRAVGLALERTLSSSTDARQQISLRMAYMLGRLFLLALAVVLARRDGGQNAGLAALVVVVAAFTVQLVASAASRPRRAR